MATSRKIREGYLYIIDTILWYYLTQYQFFQLSLSSMKEEKSWKALKNFLGYLADQLKLKAPPIPILGNEYYSTGSFSYFKDLSSLAPHLKIEYYFIAVDSLDQPIFWPLVAHEAAHCWLSGTRFVEEICTLEMAQEIKSKNDIPLEKRVEEALCDIVATKLLGPAYTWAYITRLWLHLDRRASNSYPSHSFRIECMCTLLELMEMPEVAEKIRRLKDERVKDDWRKEEISPLKDYLVELSKGFPSAVNREHYAKSLSMVGQVFTSPPDNPVLLFLSCWNYLQLCGLSNLEETLPKFTSIILKVLGG